MTHEEMVARGKYLVTIGGCNDCHSPKVIAEIGPMPDSTRLLSGHPANLIMLPVDTNLVQPAKWVMINGDHFTAWEYPILQI